ncbi:MAG: anthranilate synthase component I family protein [Chitinophagaceae bacterium]
MKKKVLNWVQQFNTFCFLDNHQYHIQPQTQECLVAAGNKGNDAFISGGSLAQLQNFIESKKNCWLFGHLNYDLKNQLERLSSNHPDFIQFPELYFFEPLILIRLNEVQMIIEGPDAVEIFNEINKIDIAPVAGVTKTKAAVIKNRIQKEEYISIIQQLQKHILRGDCYEINFCQEFFAERVNIDPLSKYIELSNISPNPFSALYRLEDKWLLCASPERFLKKEGKEILAQPIKGTSKRIYGDDSRDAQSREELFHSSKDRSENVMVVDLMRNDLARICEEGTVKVDELYGIYSFPQVHQMISTISGELKSNITFSEIIKAAFPMGSMTGAPKKRVMELIERYEKTKRGIFSGTVGYISPTFDFDFNVVIRSIMYNSLLKYLSFQTGSAITFYSDPEKEWEECLLKAEAMKKIFLQ